MQPKFIAKIESEDSPRRLAVLIDADNAQASITEVLQSPVKIDIKEPIQEITSQKVPKSKDDRKEILDIIFLAIDAVSGDSDWANLGNVVGNITKLHPNFDARLYGYKKFSQLVKSFSEYLDVDERPSSIGNESAKSIYIKKKNSKK